MQITVELPDSLANDLISAGHDAARTLLEDALLQGYRESRITARQLMEALGIESRYELDGFLKAHQVWIEYSPQQIAEDQAFQDAFVASARNVAKSG